MNARHLYIHVPFCARRCSYCDFAIAVRRTVPARDYLDALATEAALAGAPAEPETVYLGGGTPSLLGAEPVAELLALASAAGAREVTLEANPEDVSAEAARAWVRAGVTRVSLGAQSFSDRALSWMHRSHDGTTTRAAARHLREAGVADLSLDLIFALPDEVARDWRADLDAALSLEPDHVSLYGLTVEHGTPLARWIHRGASAEAPEGRYEEEYLAAHERLAAAGYAFYEVSNAARPGHEAVHNRAYWRLAPYLGLGPSAHSFDGVARWWNEGPYAAWLARVRGGERPVAGHEILSDTQRELERRYLGLRTSEGLAIPAGDMVLEQKAREWVGQGWATITPITSSPHHLITLSPKGWLRLDSLVASI